MEYLDKIKQIAIKTLQIEAESIKHLTNFIDQEFCSVIELLQKSKGRIIITGIGKSAIIANKIVATLNSTGSPAIFMHAADAIHGDLGIIQNNDKVICISNSGDSPEIKVLVPLIQQMGNTVIGITGNNESFLGKNADFTILSTVEQEACPNNLAPTSSTTAQLAMGDAIAVCLLSVNKFTKDHFAKYHPGGALGKKLFLKIGELAKQHEKPSVTTSSSIQETIIEISSKRLGATAVIDGNKLVGVVTDGDLRRMLQKATDFQNLTALDICSKNPITIDEEELAVNAVKIMKQNNISQIVVTNESGYCGFVHIHDLLKENLL